MIVVFIVVLVVFGPQKLPELARSFGKLMAEFRKASGDFRSAFEEEMRDLERQARVAELKKQAAESIAAAEAITAGTAAAGATLAEHITEAPIIVPAADSVPRLDVSLNETTHETAQVVTKDLPFPADETSAEAFPDGSSAPETKSPNPKPSHDQQQPA
jgi:Tat protein translocase TatB subunit